MSYKKSEITQFAKECVYAQNQFLNSMCIAENLKRTDIAKEFRNGIDDELLIEIAKRYAKYAKFECTIDLDNSDIQDSQNIINTIVECCEEHKWFGL